MTTQYWLVKQEPDSYAWSAFATDRRTVWDGVRNFQARNHLRAMKRGDLVLFYASGDLKSVVGIAEVSKAAFPDPTAPADEDWSAVELKAKRALAEPVSLARIKAEPALADLALLRQSRLSVVPVPEAAFTLIVKLGGG